MENKVYGQNYVIKGQMSFDGIFALALLMWKRKLLI